MTRGRGREPMPHVDAAWLRMDSPTNVMIITALLGFDEAPPFEKVRQLVEERLLRHRRFRQRVVEPALGVPHWEEDPHFHVDTHLHRIALPAPGDQAALETLLGDLTSTPLDRSQPLWQVHFVEGVGSGAALIARLHHCMGDGVALVRYLLGLTDEGEVLSPPEVGVTPPDPHGVRERAHVLASQAATLGRLLLLPGDAHTVLRGELGTEKRVAWSESIELEAIRALAHRQDAKVNDVLSGALTGALARYLEARGSMHDGLEIRALVPVYVKQEDAGHDLGNHFGLVYFTLPLAIRDPLERIAECKRRFDAIKAEPDAIVALGVLGAMGVATAELEHIGIELFTKKATVMVTNVPGPPLTIHLAGRALTDLMVWAPVSGHVGVALSLLSYAGKVRLGVASDLLRMPDPGKLAALFVEELSAALAAGSVTSTAS